MNTNINVIEGNPTKKFFIEMITRDISIEDAIIDLLDNSIDGANRINPENYTDLWINLTINDKEFVIQDNCGGFSLETAQKYAFRFGRPEEAPKANNTVGRFGIGMKRSLFKIGRDFAVESQCRNDHFKVEVNVDEWSRRTKKVTTEDGVETTIDDWSFSYKYVEKPNMADGTIIKISNLNSEVVDLFADDSFLNDLSDDIQKLLNFSLLKGIKITLNGRELTGKRIDLLISEYSKPYYADGIIDDVNYRIIAGLGGIGELKNSGWYIYCNNRLVLEADTSNITGWGVHPLPQWHINYVMFRGILFLDSEETLNLPLTTTKKGVDATSEVYKALLPIMKNAMIKVFEFLKKIPKMGDEANDYRQTLCETFDKISAVELKVYDFSDYPQKQFYAPELDMDIISRKKQYVRIAYDANKDLAELAKEHAEAKNYKELGNTTFEYYLKMEDIRNEESNCSEL